MYYCLFRSHIPPLFRQEVFVVQQGGGNVGDGKRGVLVGCCRWKPAAEGCRENGGCGGIKSGRTKASPPSGPAGGRTFSSHTQHHAIHHASSCPRFLHLRASPEVIHVSQVELGPAQLHDPPNPWARKGARNAWAASPSQPEQAKGCSGLRAMTVSLRQAAGGPVSRSMHSIYSIHCSQHFDSR